MDAQLSPQDYALIAETVADIRRRSQAYKPAGQWLDKRFGPEEVRRRYNRDRKDWTERAPRLGAWADLRAPDDPPCFRPLKRATKSEVRDLLHSKRFRLREAIHHYLAKREFMVGEEDAYRILLLSVILLWRDADKLPKLTEFQEDWDWTRSEAGTDRSESDRATRETIIASLHRTIELREHVWWRRLSDAQRGRWLELARRAWAAVRPRARADAEAERRQGADQEAVAPQYAWRRAVGGWEVVWRGDRIPVSRNYVGMGYIQVLLAHPGDKIEARELLRRCAEATLTELGLGARMSAAQANENDLTEQGPIEHPDRLAEFDAQEMERAKQQLEGERDSETDPAKQAEISEKIDTLDRYRRNAVNRWGKLRPLGSRREKARKAVWGAMDRARKALSEHEELAAHLAAHVRAGNECRYTGEICWRCSCPPLSVFEGR